MSEQEQEDRNPDKLVEGNKPFKATLTRPPVTSKSFEAYKEEEDNSEFVTIYDCRMTITTDDGAIHGRLIKEQFDLDPDDGIMALYIHGVEMRHPSNPALNTAAGRCIFFVFNEEDHGRITSKYELRIKKSAPYYFRLEDGGDQYNRESFANITNVLKNSDLVIRSSSPRSSHRFAKMYLYP